MFRWQLQGYVALGLPHPLLQAQHLEKVGEITAPNCDGSPWGPRKLCSTQSISADFVLCFGRGGAGASLGGPGHQTEVPSRDRDRDRDWSFPDSHFRKATSMWDVSVGLAGRSGTEWKEAAEGESGNHRATVRNHLAQVRAAPRVAGEELLLYKSSL